MYNYNTSNNENLKESYEIMLSAIKNEIEYEKDFIANLSNVSSIIMTLMQNINWVGFYIMKNEELVVGPFQGKPACTRIKVGKGVCGNAVLTKRTQRVYNIHEFPGHIACDSDSNSEIVIPIIINNNVVGVLDIDSPTVGRFTELEEKYLTDCVTEIREIWI